MFSSSGCFSINHVQLGDSENICFPAYIMCKRHSPSYRVFGLYVTPAKETYYSTVPGPPIFVLIINITEALTGHFTDHLHKNSIIHMFHM